ncbi:MAG TPA: SRPBCC domain-containing protein [Microthrixaceae bacterium]|nr:SRPBCC domain-containing protein [Microthrixaceae bacterium]
MEPDLDTSPARHPDHHSEHAVERVRRTIDLDQDVRELWHLVSDAAELATWLGDAVDLDITPGATGTIVDDDITHRVLVDEVVEGERIGWRWWADGGRASRVELEVTATSTGSRLVVTETRLAGAGAMPEPRGAVARRAIRWELRAAMLHLVSAPVHAVA